ncbi:heme peroxidase [Epithele typhae]|uniref:heme peroxidase n=1 Tax=Epithele typhae TaxID=378194 RepID=UPI00200890BB|nr:heme peroxidase [Epithele typhae]KAH9932122.1 heme peroxidase [Epithele typhae]
MALDLQDVVTLADVQFLSDRPLPVALDGRYDDQVRPVTGATAPQDPHSDLYRVTHNISDSLKQAAPLLKEALKPETYAAFIDGALNGDSLDDRKNLFCNMLSILCHLPQGTDVSKKLNDVVITQLYTTIPHPPVTYVGTDYPAGAEQPPARPAAASGIAATPRLPYTFRSADGTGNSPDLPNLGKAGTPYARSVQNKYPVPPASLPSPEDVFDSLLKARKFTPHPGGNSSMTFAFASLVTHQLFRTHPSDMTKNNTTSYLDLSVLYGINQTEQDSVRDKAQGKGLLYPDAFAETRLVFIPPAATALLVLFSRNHNYIADMLLQLNECGRWTNPPPEDAGKRAIQDEEIFQTARLVNCGNFMAMIFGDYVAGFLGLGRDGCSWSMNPFDPITDSNGLPVGRGEGNQCSVEFNVLYRWHPTIAEKDIKWTEDIFTNAFKGSGKQIADLTLEDFISGVFTTFMTVETDPRKRTFANLTRGPDGRFDDDALAGVLHDATDKMAGSYGARGSPPVLRLVEVLGMTQARKWGVCTMNEFREFLKLKRFESFEEWNSDPEIAVQHCASTVWHIDNLELYPGLQAEVQIMPLGPAQGLCAGYTMTRAILSDAIALVRGDRFYTTDYTPYNLTAWGFQDCARDPNNGAFGAAVPRLLFRHLPRHYPANSVYGLFPFFTPEVTKKNLTKLKVLPSYDVARPVALPPAKIVNTLTDIAATLHDRKKYATYESGVFKTTACEFSVVANVPEARQKALTQGLFPNSDAVAAHASWFGSKVQELVKAHSYVLDGVPGKRLDVIGNVVNLAPVHWVSEYILGISLKTAQRPDGLLTPQEVTDAIDLVFNAVYLNVTPENSWSTSRRASHLAQVLTQFIEKSLDDAAPHLGIATITNFFFPSHEPSHDFLKLIATSKASHKEIVSDILGFAVSSAKGLAKTVARIVDFYLDDAHSKERAEVIKLANAKDAASRGRLRGYVREAQRLAPQFAAVLREQADAPAKQPKQMYVLDMATALVNPKDFPEPLTVNPSRPAASYTTMQEASYYACLGTAAGEEFVLEMVKAVFQIPNMQRSPGRWARSTASR